VAFIASILSLITLLVGTIWFGLKKPGYSHIKHTISELGEVGATHQKQVAWYFFTPLGLLCIYIALSVYSVNIPSAILALSISLGYLGSAIFPCDRGAPIYGTWRNTIHFIFGAVGYVSGGIALMVISEDFGQPFNFFGFIVLNSALAIALLPPNMGRGAIQRISEICLFGGLTVAVFSTYQSAA